MNLKRLILPAVACALALAGCTKPASKPQGIGRQLASGSARNLAVSSDGATLVFVADIAAPAEKDAPEGIFQGTLVTVPAAGGAPRRLGGGVSTLDDAYRLSPDGKLVAYLQGFRFRDHAGTLQLAPLPSGDARQIATETTFYKFSPDGRFLGYVDGAGAHLLALAAAAGTDAKERLVASHASTFDFSADSKQMLIRRSSVAGGGELLLASVEAAAQPVRIGEIVGDYAFSPDSKGLAFSFRKGGPDKPYVLALGPVGGPYETVGKGVNSFGYSPDSKWVAFTDGMGERSGTVNLQLAPAAGGPAKRMGDNVEEYRWSPNSEAVAFRENNEEKGKRWAAIKIAKTTGDLVHNSSWPPHERMDRIPLVWSGDGRHLAFVRLVTKPETAVHLYQVSEGGGDARIVADWVYGFRYSPDNRELWYRAGCSRAGRECDLMASSLSDAAALPRKLVQGIGNFKPSAQGDRLLLTYPRLDSETAVDLGWIDLKAHAPSKGIDRYALPGAVWIDDAGTRVAYIVSERKREGVYVADLR